MDDRCWYCSEPVEEGYLLALPAVTIVLHDEHREPYALMLLARLHTDEQGRMDG